jgi:hypothetical protein
MRFLKNLFVLLAVCFLTLKVCDVVFGFFVFERQILNYGSQGRGFALREIFPNQHVEVRPMPQELSQAPSLEDKKYLIRTDANGCILSGNGLIRELSHTILFLGGNTTESRFVDKKKRFPSLVEQALRNHGFEVNAFNGVAAGSHSLHSNLNLLGKSVHLNFTAAISMHNVNDLSLLSKTGSYWNGPRTKAIMTKGDSEERKLSVFRVGLAFKDFFLPNIYGYLKPRLLASLQFATPDEYENFRSNVTLSGTELRGVEKQFSHSTISFIHLCRKWGIEPVLMTQFNQIESKTEVFKKNTWNGKA